MDARLEECELCHCRVGAKRIYCTRVRRQKFHTLNNTRSRMLTLQVP
jgi:hypothetical protein